MKGKPKKEEVEEEEVEEEVEEAEEAEAEAEAEAGGSNGGIFGNLWRKWVPVAVKAAGAEEENALEERERSDLVAPRTLECIIPLGGGFVNSKELERRRRIKGI